MNEEEIIRQIDAYIQSAETPDDMRALARSQNALPIYLDMGGCIALRTGGTFIFHPWDTQEFNRDVNPAWQIIALVHGSGKYPSLTSLLPTRNAGDLDCQFCKGTGHFVMGSKTYDRILCGKCFGLGWTNSYLESLKP